MLSCEKSWNKSISSLIKSTLKEVANFYIIQDCRYLGCDWHWLKMQFFFFFLLFTLFLVLFIDPIVFFGIIHESHYTILTNF